MDTLGRPWAADICLLSGAGRGDDGGGGLARCPSEPGATVPLIARSGARPTNQSALRAGGTSNEWWVSEEMSADGSKDIEP